MSRVTVVSIKCDACSRALAPGENAHIWTLVHGIPPQGDSWRFDLCPECHHAARPTASSQVGAFFKRALKMKVGCEFVTKAQVEKLPS